MEKNNLPTYIPGCWCGKNGMGLDLETGQYVWEDPKVTAMKKKNQRVFVFSNGRLREVRFGRLFFRMFGYTLKDKALVIRKIRKTATKMERLCAVYSKLLEVEKDDE